VTVLVRIPTILRSYTAGAAEVSTAEGTLREVIAGLDAAYPGLGGRLLDEGGQLRRFVNVYVGEEDVRFAQGLDTPVAAGARVSVIPAVAGGAPRTRGKAAGLSQMAPLGGKWRQTRSVQGKVNSGRRRKGGFRAQGT
jgi:molybdopterin converting factor small subunit